MCSTRNANASNHRMVAYAGQVGCTSQVRNYKAMQNKQSSATFTTLGDAVATYAKVKAQVIDVVDDFSNDDVGSGYGTTYTAKTKLTKLGLTTAVRSVMPRRFNKALRALVGVSWQPVGSIDLVSKATIGDLIELACGQSATPIPTGEPT